MPYAIAYKVITHPKQIGSFVGWLLEQLLGLNRSVGMFAVYLVGILLALTMLAPLVRWGQALGRSLYPSYNGALEAA